MYDNLTLENLQDFLSNLYKRKEGKKLIEDLEYYSVKDLGNGLYSCGGLTMGRRGLEEFDKALKEKALKYNK